MYRHTVRKAWLARKLGDFEHIVQKFYRIMYSLTEMYHFRCLLHFVEMKSELIGTYSGGEHYIVVAFVGHHRCNPFLEGARLSGISHVEFGQTATGSAVDELYVEPELFQQPVAGDGSLRMYGIDITGNEETDFHVSMCVWVKVDVIEKTGL